MKTHNLLPLHLPRKQVFDLLLVNYEAVVLAVYRAPDRDSQLNYVASPEPTDVINWDDKLFIVAPPHQVCVRN